MVPVVFLVFFLLPTVAGEKLAEIAAAFGKDYGVTFASGPLTGLLSRAVVIIDKSGKVAYTEQVPEVTQEPDYESVLAKL